MPNDIESADKFSKTRALTAPFCGLLIFAAQQGVMFTWDWGKNSLLQVIVWLVFAMIMLLLLLTGGGWFLTSRPRALANDEPTQMNRARAIQTGFIVSMFVGFLVVAIAPFEPLHAQEAAHIIVSAGLGCAFLVFGIAELVTDG